MLHCKTPTEIEREGFGSNNDSKLYAPNISIAFLLPSSGVVKTSRSRKEESDKDEVPTF
jgi:hypothetical protein